MKIYNDNGWVNWSSIYPDIKAFCMMVGARGTGKTYGLLRYLLENNIKFIYLRRLKTQLEECGDLAGNPFKKINSDTGSLILPYKTKTGIRFCPSEINNNKPVPVGDPVALGVSLSTVATIRGGDYSDIDCIVFDEAVAMLGEKPIKNEFQAFLNFYETVNRNREIEGKEPVKAFLLGNANKLGNPYFIGWGLMRISLNMINGGQMVYRAEENSRVLILLLHSPISERKRNTVLYKNASDDFMTMALDNAFRTDATNIKSVPLREYNHVVSVGELGFWIHKSNRQLYVSKKTDKTNYYDDYGIKLKMFVNDYAIFRIKYLAGKLVFEDYETELIFREYFSIN